MPILYVVSSYLPSLALNFFNSHFVFCIHKQQKNNTQICLFISTHIGNNNFYQLKLKAQAREEMNMVCSSTYLLLHK